ncbi:MAG: tRNA (adenosine(37)-N6)-dimethylallyltransferase MiaA [Acidiferrobacteraceae bacterium]|nr:tRNA (adenosine(37)-N6)-dimethylallyltransferase MiaA [Acidiferrobacteraceae bacterium]|tara:strand:- start:694 stop:1620 length:927 start_codon:yes stop_codon:yes gene_type:complete
MIFIFGPTATGKTDLVIQLADRYSLGIISVDAVQVYRGLNIGSAKPVESVLASYPHALVNIRDPVEQFSAGDFCIEASREVARIQSSSEIPVLVGGSMFYFAALINGLGHLPPRNSEIRATIGNIRARLGTRKLHELLRQRDPVTASRIHHNDQQRIERALEIDLLSDRLAGSSIHMSGQKRFNTPIIRIGIAFADRSDLHRRIEHRIAKMLFDGLIDEVKDLLNGGVAPETSALRSVGYRQICQHLAGEIDYADMQERMISATRQLAKRQLTWMRNTPGTVWFDASDQNIVETVSDYISQHYDKYYY